ncbi:MAG: TonB-dependent receptor plug domain-containing protein [Bacteroidales bacterium]|nr:TonB-dependent receptor plug domain-containing protein [Bacteroidales bacterium]MCB8999946.1 TonB-dependent receptor plug domain-containing protein [Bacteroidales bacterium]MCB9012603.1 TonB-dependent receptor plug domain-containing protein [Bacteroidales bacterium]
MSRLPVILLLIIAKPVFVQNLYSQNLNDTLHIQEIKIHSKRAIQDNALYVSRIDSVVLNDKANSSLSELLAEHTGIFIKTYGRGAMASASFRGTDPSHTKVLWNGIELNSPMLGMTDFSIIPMLFIDKVELFHGSSSISETSGALGGLINLQTTTDWSGNFSGSYLQGLGSYGTHDENLRINAGNSKVQSQTRIFFSHSDNDFSYVNHDIYDSVNLETGKKYYPIMKNEDAWFTYYGILQELKYRINTCDIVSMSFWGQQSSRSIPLLSTNESGRNNNVNRQEDGSLRGQVSFRHYGEKFTIDAFSGFNSMNLDYSLKNRLDSDSLLQIINSGSLSRSVYNKIKMGYIFSPGFRLELSAGADIHQVNSFEKVKQEGYSEERLQYHTSASVYKKWNRRFISNIMVGTELIQKADISPVWKAGSEFHILPEDKFYLSLSFASNTRFPSLNDLYYQPGGNILLKPEHSMDQDMGIHFNTQGGRLIYSHDISVYMSQVKNWIMWIYGPKGASPENIEYVDIKGLETEFSLKYKAEEFSCLIGGGYVLASSRDMTRSANEFDKSFGKQLPYIPLHSANAMAYTQFKTWSLSYIWNYYSKRITTTSGQSESARDVLYPYFMNSLGAGKQFSAGDSKLDINFKIHNLFNEQYRSVLQRQMPGRNYSLQLKLNF